MSWPIKLPTGRPLDNDAVEPDERARDLGVFELRDCAGPAALAPREMGHNALVPTGYSVLLATAALTRLAGSSLLSHDDASQKPN